MCLSWPFVKIYIAICNRHMYAPITIILQHNNTIDSIRNTIVIQGTWKRYSMQIMPNGTYGEIECIISHKKWRRQFCQSNIERFNIKQTYQMCANCAFKWNTQTPYNKNALELPVQHSNISPSCHWWKEKDVVSMTLSKTI